MLDWMRLEAELARWARAGRRPQLWWRDDDARTVTAALARLLKCATVAGAPISLAVIPDGIDPKLADFLNDRPSVSVLQHGTDHRSADLVGRQSQFDEAEPAPAVARRLARGWARLEGFDHRLPIYVPPWNDLTANVQAALPLAGLTHVSAWAGPTQAGRVDAHLDLLRWRPRPRFTGSARLLGRLRRALAARRRLGLWDQPIGLLTHHLDHDEAAWRFLGRLLAWPALRHAAEWRTAQELFVITVFPTTH